MATATSSSCCCPKEGRGLHCAARRRCVGCIRTQPRPPRFRRICLATVDFWDRDGEECGALAFAHPWASASSYLSSQSLADSRRNLLIMPPRVVPLSSLSLLSLQPSSARPVWWRRAVLPSLPWVVCFLSFFFTSDKRENDESGTTARWHEGCSENRREPGDCEER